KKSTSCICIFTRVYKYVQLNFRRSYIGTPGTETSLKAGSSCTHLSMRDECSSGKTSSHPIFKFQSCRNRSFCCNSTGDNNSIGSNILCATDKTYRFVHITGGCSSNLDKLHFRVSFFKFQKIPSTGTFTLSLSD